MPSTYSPSLRLEIIGTGEQDGTWGTTTNTNIGTLLEQAITGVTNVPMIDADYTLSNYNGVSDESRNAVLLVTGTNAAIRKVIAPLAEKIYLVQNATSGGYAITIGASSGTSATVNNGSTAIVYCDGTNFYTATLGLTTTNWTTAQVGSKLYFYYSGSPKMSLDSSGNMIIAGTLTQSATP